MGVGIGIPGFGLLFTYFVCMVATDGQSTYIGGQIGKPTNISSPSKELTKYDALSSWVEV